MDLRTIKKEVLQLPNISKNAENLQKNWVKPIRSNTNAHLPFLKSLSPATKKHLNQKLASFHSTIFQLKQNEHLHNKLHHSTRYLIDLKLHNIRQNHTKSKILTNSLLNDDFMSIKQTIADVKSFDANVQKLHKQYHEINSLLQKELSLEEAVFFMDLPHKKYLHSLIKTSKQHKKIVRHIGRHFVKLAKENRRPKK